MDSRQKMHVADWQDSPGPDLVEKRQTRHYLSPTLIGILGTLLLHALLIQLLPFGSHSSKVKHPESQESANLLAKFKADAAESLVLIRLPTTANSQQPAIRNLITSLPDLSKMKFKSPVKVDPPAFLDIETLALSENDQASKSANEGSEGAEQSRLFGIYTGQIQARIDRVWRRPRSPVNEGTVSAAAADAGDSFQCEVQIVQDDRGNVQEILLPRCNGSSAWQRSLVLAIRQASPLPAPPSASVFSQSITLDFLGLSFIAGAPEDDYEPERRILIGAQQQK
jgi:hypothetical protein